MNTIVLKDALGADITLAYIGNTPDGVVFERKSETLLGRTRVQLSLVETNKTNRVRGKLTVPAVASAADGVPTIQYTEIGSFDFSVFRAGHESGRKDIAAMFASLIANPAVVGAIVDGIKPSL